MILRRSVIFRAPGQHLSNITVFSVFSLCLSPSSFLWITGFYLNVLFTFQEISPVIFTFFVTLIALLFASFYSELTVRAFSYPSSDLHFPKFCCEVPSHLFLMQSLLQFQAVTEAGGDTSMQGGVCVPGVSYPFN